MIAWPKGACVALALVTLAACGSGDSAPRPELGAALEAVSQARDAEAPRYASDAFNRANKKLAEAQTALADGNHARARRLAEEARVDAELAKAATESAKQSAALDTVRQKVDKLQKKVHVTPAQAPATAPTSLESPAGASSQSR